MNNIEVSDKISIPISYNHKIAHHKRQLLKVTRLKIIYYQY